MLEGLGLTTTQARCYELLVRRPRLTRAEIAELTGLGRADAHNVLDALEDQGLVSSTTDEPPRVLPAPPEVAVEALVVRRQQALERTRLHASALMETYRTGRLQRHGPELVEVVEGPEAQMQRLRQLTRVARHEILALDKPPYATPPAEQMRNEYDLLQRVRVRAIYERQVLEDPEATARLADLVAAGEQARVLKRVPMKLVVADRLLASHSSPTRSASRPPLWCTRAGCSTPCVSCSRCFGHKPLPLS